jgi:hypothetical protein
MLQILFVSPISELTPHACKSKYNFKHLLEMNLIRMCHHDEHIYIPRNGIWEFGNLH